MFGMLSTDTDEEKSIQVMCCSVCSYRNERVTHIFNCRCPGCGWPLCGPKCVGLKSDNGHSSWECSTLREKRVADHLDRSKGKELIKMYEAVAPFRCLLLKKHDPLRWERLNKMEAHNDIRRNISSLWNRNQEVVVNRLRNVWGFNEFSEEEIHTVCGILEGAMIALL